MEIILNVPETSCAKCGVKAPLDPDFIFRDRGKHSKALQQMLQVFAGHAIHAGASQQGFTTLDSNGETWSGILRALPEGWVKGPVGGLCHACGEAWIAAVRGFMPEGSVEGAGAIKLAKEPIAEAVAAIFQADNVPPVPLVTNPFALDTSTIPTVRTVEKTAAAVVAHPMSGTFAGGLGGGKVVSPPNAAPVVNTSSIPVQAPQGSAPVTKR